MIDINTGKWNSMHTYNAMVEDVPQCAAAVSVFAFHMHTFYLAVWNNPRMVIGLDDVYLVLIV